MLIDAIKRRINAAVDEQNARDNLFNLKIAHVWGRIKNRIFTIGGATYIPVRVHYYHTNYNDDKKYVLSITFAQRPQDLRTRYKLTDVERKIIKMYESDIYNKFKIDTNNNKDLIDEIYNGDFHWRLYECKNKIQITKTMEWCYTLDDITCDTFVTNGLSIDGDCLWRF